MYVPVVGRVATLKVTLLSAQNNGISIKPEWVPRSKMSSTVDFDDWFDSPRILRIFAQSHSIDRFVGEHNHLLPKIDFRF